MTKRIIPHTIWLLLLFHTQWAMGQFEGQIDFLQRINKDTLYCTFYVKEPLVKYEERFTNGVIKRYLVVDLQKGESVSVQPSVKLVKRDKLPQAVNKGSYIIFKKENTRTINNRQCMQWVVKNEKENQMVIFYVDKKDYAFYAKLAPYAAHFSETFRYFSAITGTAGYMPLGVTCTSLMWEHRFTLDLLKMKPAKLSDALFQTPQ